MKFSAAVILFLFISCSGKQKTNATKNSEEKDYATIHTKNPTGTYIVVLGTVQDGGSPHIGCTKDCCKYLWEHPDPLRKVVSLGLVDSERKKSYLFEATPDMPAQLKILKRYSHSEFPEEIYLTHAHIGHYAGLMYLGKEAKNTVKQKVYAMPRMKSFLEKNGPWSQLVNDSNIVVMDLETDTPYFVNDIDLSIIPFCVPHRDEFSETVGYWIHSSHKSAVFIPDIDKWSKWNKDIKEIIKRVDYAFIDGTFYDGNELPGRDMSKIPHPFIVESMELFKDLPASEKKKIYFIHFNHSNPVLNENSEQARTVIKNGFNLARMNMVLEL